MTNPVILITGGSGLVGSGLLRSLRSQNPQLRFVVLTRRPTAIYCTPRVIAIEGDVCQPNLGLSGLSARFLREQVTGIIHCAANVKFTSSLKEARAVNTKGTARVLDFAEQCPRLEKLAHISTLFIAGRRPGLLAEEPLHHRWGHFNVYTRTKHEAEKMVLDRMKTLPIAIYRLSSIIGHSTTGRVSQNNYFHSVIRLLPRTQNVAVIRGDPEAPVDLIAHDWAASAIALLYEKHFVPGKIHHICAGRDHSLKAGELLSLAFRVYNQGEKIPLKVPELSTRCTLDETLSMWRDRAMLPLLGTFLPHLAVNQPFDSGATGHVLAAAGLKLPSAEHFVGAVLRRILATAVRRKRLSG